MKNEKVKELLPDDYCLIWCDTNYEADILKELIPNAYELRGDDKPEKKEELLIGFGNGDFKHLITKSSIAGMGLNYQHCNNTIFTGLNYSYESYYQSIRRFWRFGQTREVTEIKIITNKTIERKVWYAISTKKKMIVLEMIEGLEMLNIK